MTDALTRLKETARRALPDARFAEREEALLALFEEAGRGLLEDELQSLADGLGDRVLVGGVEYKRHELGTVQYYCLGGTIQLQRDSYRRVGVHNGRTVVPVELESVKGVTLASSAGVGPSLARGRTLRATPVMKRASRWGRGTEPDYELGLTSTV